MTENYFDPIAVGESNSPATVNTRFSTIDTAVTDIATLIDAAAGIYADINARFNSLVLAGGNVSTLTNGAAAAAQKVVNVDSSTGFIANARVAYALAGGTLEYNTIDIVNGATQVTLDNNIGTGGIGDNTLFTMISESEFQAAQVSPAAVTGISRTLPAAIEWLQREVNVKAFGAYGDGSSHLVGAGAALTAAQAKYPLTHAARTITSADQHDWCAIQEALHRAVAGSGPERVRIPEGVYQINRTLIVPSTNHAITVEGGGFRGSVTGTTLQATAAFPLLLVPGLTTLRELSLIGADKTNANSIAIYIGGDSSFLAPWPHTNSQNVLIDHINFGDNWYDGIRCIYECDHLHVIGCRYEKVCGRAAVYLSNDTDSIGTAPTAGAVIELNSFAGTQSVTSNENLYGVYLFGTENCVIRNNTIRGYDHMIYLAGESGGGVRNDGLVISGIHSEICTDLKSYTSNRWAPNTAYSLNHLLRPSPTNANGWWYKCTTAGTSAATSIRTATYRWVASSKGTNEYYVELAAGGDPSITVPPFGVVENGTAMTRGWLGGLTAGQWGYGNNDSLGFSTIYVRLTDGTDPDSKALHYVWTTSNEPVWPTTYGATVVDGTAVWQAYKRSVFVGTDALADVITGGLKIDSCWGEHFAIWIDQQAGLGGSEPRYLMENCTVRTADLIYAARADLRASLLLQNNSLTGTIRPYSTTATNTGQQNNQTAVYSRFNNFSGDLLGFFSNSQFGTSSWFTGESNANRSSGSFRTTSYVVNPVGDSHIQADVGAGGITITIPPIGALVWHAGLRNKTITITKVTGAGSLTLAFNNEERLMHNGTSVASLVMADAGDSITIALGMTASNTIRWVIVGGYGI